MDPTNPGYPHPEFFADVFERPPRPDWLPLERLACLSLAWLADRDRGFALDLVRLFCGEEGIAVAGDRAIGARAGITLPRADAAAVFPDLSLDVEGRALQVLVEVKVDAEFREHGSGDEATLQPLTYAVAWAATPNDEREASERWLGTLTRSGDADTGAGTWPQASFRRARDVGWPQVLPALARVRDADGPWAELAGELSAGMSPAVMPPSPQDAGPLLTSGAALLETLAPAVAGRLAGCTLGSRLAPRPTAGYVGRYMRIMRAESSCSCG